MAKSVDEVASAAHLTLKKCQSPMASMETPFEAITQKGYIDNAGVGQRGCISRQKYSDKEAGDSDSSAIGQEAREQRVISPTPDTMSRRRRRSPLVLVLCCWCAVGGSGRRLPEVSSFAKEIVIPEEQVAQRVWPPVTEGGSFVYATCDASDPVYFREKRCNVSVETPALSGATFRDSCPVVVAPDGAGQEALSHLRVLPFGDERVVLSWLQAEWLGGTPTAKLKILDMSSCSSVDLALPSDAVPFVVSYGGTTMDVGLRSDVYCGATVCKLRLNASGEIVDGPSAIFDDVDLLFYYALTPVPADSEDDGFYLSAAYKDREALREHVFKVAADGSKTELMSFSPGHYSSYSTSRRMLSVCTSTGNTTVTCYQHYSALNLLTNRSLEFEDGPLQRWFQPHNLRDGGMLLATGRASDEQARRYDSFSVIKLSANGRKSRPLTVHGLDFACRRLEALLVVVSESEHDDDVCFNFSCSRGDALRFASKCLPRSRVVMSPRSPAVVN
ncbi:uncharacterized protein LOC131667078 [Phymastichus coffea]|uniref:uncharacterized protein LOC131667078 n=1 Tax=Phymastichus coffea TaxID=108790 RepID=UPI00273AC090|nr:uncharacterized protein LOC131667078 [Phymastichus coffea]